MYALDYANSNFNYAYKGNYNNIYLFNDKKPPNFEVVETTQDTSGYYLLVEVVEDSEYIIPLINVNANFIEQIGGDLQEYLNTITDTEEPQLISASTADYLLSQGYMKDLGIEKKLANPNVPLGYLDRNLYQINGKYYILGGDGTHLDEVVLTAINPNQSVKPFMDFDDEIDKENNQLIVMVSSDGAKIDDAYLNVNQVNSNEIVLFIESIEGSNIFGSSVRVRTGSGVSEINGSQRRIIKNLLKAMDLDIDEPKIVRILKKHIENTSDSPIVYYIKKGFLGLNSIIVMTLNLPLGALGSVATTIADAIEKELRLGENRWRHYTKEGKVNEERNLFLPIDWLVDSINEQFLKNEKTSKITKGWIEAIEAKGDEIIQWLYTEVSGLNQDISKQLKVFIEALSKGFKNLISALKDGIKKIANHSIDSLLFINGLVVGIINSILDTVAFIFQIIGFLFNPKTASENAKNIVNETGATISLFLEVLENGIDILGEIFSKKTLNTIVFFQIQVAVLLYQSVTNTDPKKALNFSLPKADSMGYFIGFIIGFIIEEIITAMLTAGTANVAKASQLALKSMKETLQSLKALPVKIITKLDNIAQKGTTQVVLLLSNLRKLLDNLPALLNDLLKWLEKVLLDAVAFLDRMYSKHFNQSIRKQLEKLGIRPSKFDEATNTFTFCPIKIV
tara:strand:+ start:378 stop:2414 length:2037 start_codon:yes stop_codon:yes gene_type:complete